MIAHICDKNVAMLIDCDTYRVIEAGSGRQTINMPLLLTAT